MNIPTDMDSSKRWVKFSIVFFLIGYAVVAGGVVWSKLYWPSLMVGVCFLGGVLLWRSRIEPGGLPRTGVEAGLLVYFSIAVVSMLQSGNPQDGLTFITLVLTYGTVFYLLVDLFDVGLDSKLVIVGLVVVTGMLNFFAVLETYLWYAAWWREIGSMWVAPPVPYRFVSLIRHPNALMAMVNVIAPFTIILWKNTRNVPYRVLLIYWWIFYILVIPWSSSRGGWLGVAVWLTVFIVLQVSEQGLLGFFNRYWRSRSYAQQIGLFLALVGLAILGWWLWGFQGSHPSHGSALFGSRATIWGNALSIWKSNRWLGAGPGRFGFEYVRHESVPPNFWAFYAHSIPFQTLAELGILGLLALSLLVFLIARKLIRMYIIAKRGQKAWVGAALAGLTAFALHCLIDDFTYAPAVMLPIVIVLAVVWHVGGQATANRWPRFTEVIPLIAGICILGYLGWTAWVYQPLAQAVRAGDAGDWEAATSLAEQSLARSPNSAFYNIEAGLAHARIWEQSGGVENLARAREYLRVGLNLEPIFSVYYADLAILDWQAGDVSGALMEIRRAVSLAPQEPFFGVLEGWFSEQSGNYLAAEQAYRRALLLKPKWVSHSYWEQTDLRRSLRDQLMEPVDIPLEESYFARAWQAYESASWEEVQRLLITGKWAGEKGLDYWVLSGLLAEARGDDEEAQQFYEQLVDELQSRQWVLGYGYYRDVNIGAYRQDGFHFDLVSSFLPFEMGIGQDEALERLLHWYTLQGDKQGAADVQALLDLMDASELLE